MHVDDYIQNEIQKPFVWGETDCCWTANRWIEIQTGKAPLNNLNRLFYSTKEEADFLLKKMTLIDLVSEILNKHTKTKTPEIGDIGIILVSACKIAVALKIKEGWFTRDEGGLIIAPNHTHLIKAWKLCHN